MLRTFVLIRIRIGESYSCSDSGTYVNGRVFMSSLKNLELHLQLRNDLVKHIDARPGRGGATGDLSSLEGSDMEYVVLPSSEGDYDDTDLEEEVVLGQNEDGSFDYYGYYNYQIPDDFEHAVEHGHADGHVGDEYQHDGDYDEDSGDEEDSDDNAEDDDNEEYDEEYDDDDDDAPYDDADEDKLIVSLWVEVHLENEEEDEQLNNTNLLEQLLQRLTIHNGNPNERTIKYLKTRLNVITSEEQSAMDSYKKKEGKPFRFFNCYVILKNSFSEYNPSPFEDSSPESSDEE
ncbi:protein PFC0760c-like [Papaver somniferum]|uniref:protein PFC0760c-like n=1 Tax=Papaver somniferum TaxID=3469 RepID=UPI000E6FAFE4|nr:protein PFC0760c-like [Papaver somniferum]